MSQIVEDILSQIGNMSQVERAELAHAFLNSLDPNDGLSAADFDAELDARLDGIEAGTAVGRPAEDVFADLRGHR